MEKRDTFIDGAIGEILVQLEPLHIIERYLGEKDSLDDSEIFSVKLSIQNAIYSIAQRVEDLEEEIDRHFNKLEGNLQETKEVEC